VPDLQLNAQTITASGTAGTTAPAAGTSETWSVVALGAVPALTAGQTYALVDAGAGASSAQAAEIIRVTITGTTSIIVTRGADGTAPVAHAASAVYAVVVVASALAALNPPHALLTSPVTSTMLPSGVETNIPFTGAAEDTGMWSSVHPERLTAVAAGLYLVIGTATVMGGGTTGTLRLMNINKNGAGYPGARQRSQEASGDYWTGNASALIRLAIGDYVSISCLQNSGVNLAIEAPQCSLEMIAVSLSPS